MYEFTKIQMSQLDENEYYDFENKTVFTTLPWLQYLLEDNKGSQLILIRITKNDKDFVGYFTGILIRKFGIRIIGSPFRGWSTCYMGFDLKCADEKLAVLRELKDYLFREYRCLYMEITDRDIKMEEAQKEYRVKIADTLELRIDRTDEELFSVFKTDCRNFIRQFERRGAVLEIAEPVDEFAEEYYSELIDVFAKQNLVPTYSLDKVKSLLKSLRDSGEVLCLRVRDPEGKIIASSIYPFWGGASLRPYQKYRPNEYMIWKAIQYWRERGVEVFDMVGVRDYKKKFGSHYEEYPCIIITRYKGLILLRDMAEKFYFAWDKVKGKILGRK